MINDLERFNSLTFFFPYREVSGVPILFSRLALFLSENTDLQINVVDYVDGVMGKEVSSNKGINHITFSDGINCEIPNMTVLIFQSFLPSRFKNELIIKPETKILFWTLHQDNLVPVLLPFPILRSIEVNSFCFYKTFVRLFARNSFKKTKELISLSNRHSALFFMDSSTQEKTFQYLFLDKEPKEYLPLPASDATRRKAKSDNKFISFGWVGRLCDFKSYILMYTIQRVSRYAHKNKRPTSYHIVGKGEFYESIQSCYEPNEYFTLKMHGEIAPENLENFLISTIDILTAMGTSVLEGAKLGIPSIVLDISYKPIKEDYVYRWIFNTKNFDLAHQIASSDFSENNQSLESMIEEMTESYSYLSKRSLDYYTNNHSISAVAEKLKNFAKNSSLEFRLIDKSLFRKSLSRMIYNRMKGYK